MKLNVYQKVERGLRKSGLGAFRLIECMSFPLDILSSIGYIKSLLTYIIYPYQVTRNRKHHSLTTLSVDQYIICDVPKCICLLLALTKLS